MSVKEVAVATKLWDLLSERHQQMLDRIVELAAVEGVAGRIDPDHWELWLQEFEGAAQARESLPVVEDVIERGYRRVLFAANEEVKALEEIGTDSPLWAYRAEQVEEVLAEYEDED